MVSATANGMRHTAFEPLIVATDCAAVAPCLPITSVTVAPSGKSWYEGGSEPGT